MAIEWASPEYFSRGRNQSAVAAFAYDLRTQLFDERVGELTDDWSHLAETRLYYELWAGEIHDPGYLANLIEAAERRKDSQVLFGLVIALPADREISDQERVQMAREFAIDHFVSKGLAVMLTIHQPRSVPEGAVPNYHAHIKVSTRRLEGDRFATHKATDLHPQVRTSRFGRFVTDAPNLWGATWREWQDRWFEQHGKNLRVDPQGLIPYLHIGAVRHRKPDDPRIAENERRRAINEEHKETLWDIACELDSKVAAIDTERRDLQDKLNAHLAEVHHAEGAIGWLERKHEEATEELAKRWEEMNLLRRALHYLGSIPQLSALRDIDIEKWERTQAIMKRRAEQKWSIKRTYEDGLAQGIETDIISLREQARQAMAPIRADAVRELAIRNAQRKSQERPEQQAERHVERPAQRVSRRRR